MFKKLLKNGLLAQSRSASVDSIKKGYQKSPRFTQFLPWLGFDSDNQVYLLEDGLSVATVLDISPLPVLTQNEAQMASVMEKIVRLLKTTLTFDAASPYHLQCYVYDDNDMSGYLKNLENSIRPEIREAAYTQDYLKMMQEHMQLATHKGGMFFDEMVTQNTFRAKNRTVRLAIYRRINEKSFKKKGRTHVQMHNGELKKLVRQLQANGMKVRKVTPNAFIDWMRAWFSPQKASELRVPENHDDLPFGYDFAQQCVLSSPRSCQETGVWFFDEMPHRLITMEYLFDAPKPGHMSAEREHFEGQRYAFLDKLPEGSIWVMNIVLQDIDATTAHLNQIEKSAVGKREKVAPIKEECQVATQIARGQGLYPVAMGVYIRANSLDELSSQEVEVEAMLKQHDLAPRDTHCEVAPLEAYLKFLPMNYHFEWDRKFTRQSHYMTGEHVARLLPIYGAHRGSGHPTSQYFTRSGEVICFDKHKDKTMNSHMLVMGSTGAGKSADAIYMMKGWMACYKPRLVIIEAGQSFNLFMEEAKELGLSTFDCILEPKTTKPLNPLYDAMKIEDWSQKEQALDRLDSTFDDGGVDNEDLDGNRDLLAEAIAALTLVITGGEEKELVHFRRYHRAILGEAIFKAKAAVIKQGRNQMILSDVESALREISAESKKTDLDGAKDAKRFADSIRQLTQESFSAKTFNQESEGLPDADIIRIDLGILKADDKIPQMGLAMMGILNLVMARAEHHQYDERPMEIVIDESHVIMRNLLVLVCITQASKMARKYGVSLTLSTQNLDDFHDDSVKMLSMFEFFKLLNTSAAEIKQVQRFVQLSEEHVKQIKSIRKQPGCYTEGYLVSPKQSILYRSVPPRPILALAMTDKSEKAQRCKIMKQQDCSEIEAARVMAAEMKDVILERQPIDI